MKGKMEAEKKISESNSNRVRPWLQDLLVLSLGFAIGFFQLFWGQAAPEDRERDSRGRSRLNAQKMVLESREKSWQEYRDTIKRVARLEAELWSSDRDWIRERLEARGDAPLVPKGTILLGD